MRAIGISSLCALLYERHLPVDGYSLRCDQILQTAQQSTQAQTRDLRQSAGAVSNQTGAHTLLSSLKRLAAHLVTFRATLSNLEWK